MYTEDKELIRLSIQHTNIWSEFFGEHLRGQFRAEEAQVKDCLPRVVLVGAHSQIGQHVVGQSLGNIPAVQLKAKEHEADESTNLPVDLVHTSQLAQSDSDYTLADVVFWVSLTLLTSFFSSFSVHWNVGS